MELMSKAVQLLRADPDWMKFIASLRVRFKHQLTGYVTVFFPTKGRIQVLDSARWMEIVGPGDNA
jgi:hypothetical protein